MLGGDATTLRPVRHPHKSRLVTPWLQPLMVTMICEGRPIVTSI